MQTQIALVTGGSRGIGRDIALSLAKRGIGVVLTYKERAKDAAGVVAEIEAAGGAALALALDVSQAAGLGAFFDRLRAALSRRWGSAKIDYLVNNGGTGATKSIADLDEAAFDAVADMHFKGVVFLTQKALAMMNDGGAVVFISAASTHIYVPGFAMYSACKAAIEAFSRYVAKEVGARGIRSNVVAPGGIETDFLGGLIRNSPEVQAHLRAQTALGRVGHADDIGSIVAFLCSPDARWIDGQRIEATGGYHM